MNLISRIALALLLTLEAEKTFAGDKPAQPGNKPAAMWLGRLLLEKSGDRMGVLSKPRAVNNRGVVTGSALAGKTYEDSVDHAFLSVDGKMTDLGVLPGYEGGSWALLINDSGQVAGSSGKRDEDIVEDSHAFLYEKGKMTDLGTLGGNFSRAEAINQSGLIAGYSATAASGSHAFIYEKGKMRDLGTLGGNFSDACAINSSGLVAGESTTASGEQHAYIYEKEKMRDLGTYGAFKFFQVSGMNDAGEIVGTMSTTSNAEVSHAYYYKSGRFHDIGISDAPSCKVEAVNNAGDIAGEFFVKEEKRTHAFLYSGGKLIDLTKLIKNDTGGYCQATHVNSRGEVLVMQLGKQRNDQRHYLYSKGSMIDLSALIDKTKSYHAAWVTGLNDAGQAICLGDTPEGEGGFLFNYNSKAQPRKKV